MKLMEKVSFETWWEEYLAKFPDRWTSGNEVADELANYLTNSDEVERASLLQGLTNIVLQKARAWWIAGDALVHCSTLTNRRVIVDFMREHKIIGTNDALSRDFIGNIKYHSKPERARDRQWSILILRILAGETSNEFLILIEQYIGAPQIEDEYFSICWTLWKNHPNLAVTGWVRFFTSDSSRPRSH